MYLEEALEIHASSFKKKGRVLLKNRKKKSHSLLMKFAILMIFSGIAILLYPIVGNYLANRERSQASTAYDNALEKMSKKEREEQYKLAKEYNKYIFGKQQGKEVEPILYESVLKNKSKVMGTIDIPAIDIEKMPFFHGTSFKTLDKGLGHLKESSVPIGGKDSRAVITGHSGVKNQVLFTDIRNLTEGDLFFINILGKRLAYQIDSFEEILPSEAEKVKIVPGKDQVTLLTCTPPGINTYRLLVTGHRIPYKDAMKKKIKKRNLWSYQTIVLGTIGINLLLFLILVAIYRHQVKRFRSDNPKVVEKARKRLRLLFRVTKGYFVLLFVIMSAVLSVAIYGYAHMQQETTVSAVDIGRDESLSDYNLNKISKANYEEKQIASVSVADYAHAKAVTKDTINNWGIGKLVIPEAQINLPILAGLANENLLTGVATYKLDQQLGKNNYVLLAHNIYDQDLLLHRIEKLKNGDMIYATDYRDIYIYEVNLNKVVRDIEVSYIEKSNEQEAKITLVRCEGNIGTIYRRVVQGKLTGVQPLDDSSENQMKQMDLKKSEKKSNGVVVKKEPVTEFDSFSMAVAARFVADPLQTIIPMFLFFLLPILFFSLMR